MADIYDLLHPSDCFAKTHKEGYLEAYDSHVNVAVAFIEPVLEIFKLRAPLDYIREMVALHDIGKRGSEFQDRIKGRNEPQYIRHEELAFIKWLDEYQELRSLDKPRILAILAHHKTLIDDESAIMIERYIADRPNWEDLSNKWLKIIKTPRERQIDVVFLSALPLVDILRTIDILASYTTETILLKHLGLPYSNSIYENKRNDVNMELCSLNLKSSEIEFGVLNSSEERIKLQLFKPVNSIVEYRRIEIK